MMIKDDENENENEMMRVRMNKMIKDDESE